MTSNHHALYDLGYTYYNGVKQREARPRWSKTRETSQFGLQAATRLHEVGIVIVDKVCHGEIRSRSLVHTARHTMRAGDPKVGSDPTASEDAGH